MRIGQNHRLDTGREQQPLARRSGEPHATTDRSSVQLDAAKKAETLADKLKKSAPVDRSKLLADVSQRLSRGDYLTRDSAQNTANAILNSTEF